MSAYDGAVVMCPECGGECYTFKGRPWQGSNWYRCPRCKTERSLPDLVFSPVHFLALYQGGRLYAWRALESGNFPALRYESPPKAVYNADIDIYHAAHYIGDIWQRDRIVELCDHLSEGARAALIAGRPVPVFFLEFKGVNC